MSARVWSGKRIALALALVVSVVPVVFAAQAARGSVEMRFACAKKDDGQLRYVARAGQCKSSERLIRFRDDRVVACAHQGGFVYVVGNRAACKSRQHAPSLTLVLPSDERNSFCADRRSGRLRSIRHVPYDPPRPPRLAPSTCKESEKRVVVAKRNRRPRAEDDSATIGEDGAGSIPVLANDSDPEDDSLTVARIFATGLQGSVAISADRGSVTYDPSGRFEALGAGASATETFAYAATDGRRRDRARATVTVRGVNDAPRAAADAAATDEDTATTIAVLGNDSDVDSGDVLAVTAVDTAGTAGAVASNPDGTVRYAPASRLDDLDAGEQRIDRFGYTVSDGHGGSAAATASVTVAGVNDAAAVTPSAGAAAYTENGAPTPVDGGLGVADPDDASLEGARVRISDGFDAGDELLYTDPSGTITDTYDSGTGVLTLAGTSSVANYQAALRSIDFRHTGDDPAASKTLEYRADDGDGLGPAATRNIDVTPVDDRPAITTSAGAVGYTENDPATAVDPGLVLTDPDSTEISGATVRITDNHASAEDVLALPAQPNVAGAYDAASGTLTLTGTDTVANYQAALRAVTYRNTSSNPYDAQRTVTFVASDATSSSLGATRNVNVSATDNAPDTDNSAGALAYTENDPATAIDPTIAITDPDSVNLTGATVQITGNYANGEDVLALPAQPVVTASFDAPSGRLTLSGTDSIAAYEAALEAVTYDNTSDAPSASPRTVTYQARDAGGFGLTDTHGITIAPDNDAPVLTVPGAQSTQEETPKSLDFAVADVDAGTDDLEVVLGVAHGTLTVTSGAATVTGNGTGGVTLTGSLAELGPALNGVIYEPGMNYSGGEILSIVANDLGHSPAPARGDSETVAISVAAVNDAPVHAVPGAQALDEDGSLTLSNALSVSDADAGSDDLRVELDVDHGKLWVGPTTASVMDDGTGHVTLLGDLTELNAALADVDYQPDANYNGGDTLSMATDDQGHTGGGGAQTDTDTVAITVNAVNDAPVNAVPGAQTTDEDTPKSLDLSVADVDAGTDDLEVVLGVDHGTLTLAGTGGLTSLSGDGTADVTLRGSLPELDAALDGVEYDPDTNYNGPDTLSMATDDLGHSPAPAQTDLDAVAITADAVNDAPVNGVPSGTQEVVRDEALTFSPALTVADVDAGSDDVQVSLAVGHGTLTIGGTTGLSFTAGDGTADPAMMFEGSLGDVNAALAGTSFTPTPGYSGSDTLTISTDDLGHNPAPARTDTDIVAISVLEPNDPPLNALPASVSVDEDVAHTFSTAGVSDPDAGTDALEVDIDAGHGTVDLDGTTGLTFTRGDGSDDAGMTFTGSQSSIDAALSGMSYTGDLNFNGGDTLTLVTDDQGHNGVGGAETDTDVTAITVDAVNDAPVNGLPVAQTVAEDGTLTMDPVTVSDVDAGSDTVELSLSAGHGALTLASGGGLTFTAGDGNADPAMTFSGTLAQVNAAMDGIGYEPDANHAGADALHVVSDDHGHSGSGGAKADVDDLAITVTGVNDAPVLTVPGAQTVDENGTRTLAAADALSVADIDAAPAPVEVTLGAGHGKLSLNGTTGLTFTAGDGTTDATMTFSGTLANVNGALDGLVYTPDDDYSGPDTLSASVSDLGNSGSGGALTDSESVAFTVTPSNSAPVNSVPGTQTFDEDTVREFRSVNANAISVSDSDAGGADLEIDLTVASGTLTLATTAGLTSVTGDGSGSVTFRGSASELNDAMNGLAYDSDQNFNGNDTLTIVTDDLGNTGPPGPKTDTDTVTLSVTAVNDAPVNTVPGAQSVDEDTDLTFSTISVGDVDAGTLRVSLAATDGTLTLSGTTGLTFSTGDGTADPAMTFQGSTANVNAALNGSTYRGDLNYFGPDALTVAVSDLGASGSGGTQTDSDDVAITVNPVNDDPLADDETFDGANGAIGNTTLVVNDDSDPALDPAHPHKSVTPLNGDLLHGDTDVDGPGPLTVQDGTYGTTGGGSVAIEEDGDFAYTPAAGTSCGAASDGFDYTVEDGGGGTGVGTVTIELSGCVWYVNNDPGATGNAGTSSAPFDTLEQADTASGAGHTVFVHDSPTAYGGDGYAMSSGERLIGEHEGLQIGGAELHPATNDAHPTLTALNQDVVALSTGNEIRGVTVDPDGTSGGIVGASGDTGVTIDDVNIADNGTVATEPGLDLDTMTGTSTVSNLDVDARSTGVRVNSAGTVNFTPAGQISISSTGAPGLLASGTNLGTSTFDDITVTNSTAGGVSLSNLTGTTSLNIGDGAGTDLDVTTNSGSAAGFFADGVPNLSVGSGGTDVIHATGGPAVDVRNSSGAVLDFEDADSTGSANDGVNLDGLGSGTFNAASASTISGAAGIAFDVNGGNGSIDFDGTIANGEGTTADITNRNGNTSLDGPITDTGDVDGAQETAINLSGNGGGAVTSITNATKTLSTFEDHAIVMTGSDNHTLNATGGGLQINTTAGKGLEADASGTLSVTGSGNTISTATGRALNVSTTDIGAGDLTFRQIASNGAPNGIRLNATGSNGGLNVTGTGVAPSGGTINGSTAPGIELTGVGGGVDLDGVNVTNGLEDGIRATTVAGMAVADSTLTNNGDSGTEERGLDYLNVTGAASILRTTVQTSHDTNAHVLNTAAGTTNLTVDDSTFSASEGNTGFRVRGEGPSTMVANVTDSTFSANFDVGFSMQTDSANTAQQTLLFHNNDVSGGHAGAVSGRPQISINVGGSSNVKATVSNNDVKSALGHEIILNTSASSTTTATFDATVSGNDVGDAQPGALDPGTDGGTGINGWLHGDGVARLAISNNTVQNWGGRAMELSHNDGVGTADYTVSNNALSNPDSSANVFEGIYAFAGGAAGDSSDVCIDMDNNDFDGIGRNGVSDMALDRFNGNDLRFAGVNSALIGDLQTQLRTANPLSPAFTVETYSFPQTATTATSCAPPVGTPNP